MAHRAGSLGRGPRLCHNDLMISHICGFGSGDSRSPVRGRAGQRGRRQTRCGVWVGGFGGSTGGGRHGRVPRGVGGPEVGGSFEREPARRSCKRAGTALGSVTSSATTPTKTASSWPRTRLGAGRRRCRPFQRGGWPGTRRTRWGPSPARWPGPVPRWGPPGAETGPLPLVWTGTGSAWRPAATVALPAGASGSGTFSAVSCTKAGTCLAVGTYGYLFNYHDMAVLSTGGQWDQAVEVELPPGGRPRSPVLTPSLVRGPGASRSVSTTRAFM